MDYVTNRVGVAMSSVSSFTATTTPASERTRNHAERVKSVTNCSCKTSETTREQIRVLEERITTERHAREEAQKQLKAAARELDLMEQMLMKRGGMKEGLESDK
eukprot:TRINITY_DN1907_c2_g1_i2.p1 TRINITY_DN1907_c2_g1~~TRINITY_DN1907_c2_g1_i2.p1  ORF type:complete len:104 (+),score=23.57 TRINITY_DN1907_c2_g1_i2:116-427(+)